ncbi:L,D-transpeptidase family protein [Candidatus Thiosymbion oneisti]|uniref:L,D-transpeptidase family protein n=1 Tax=Candidatus Thiosymbion oneisti TaxID=589554 RepID=UPI000AFE480E|nr:L,D-transpeptidase family protein [Candidatus Thiosymbion oneisti]
MKRQQPQRNPQSGWVAALGLALVGVSCALPAAQTGYWLPNPDDSVFGQIFYVKSERKDTLLDLGRRSGFGYDEMKSANPGVDTWLPGKGTHVLVPAQYVLPQAPRQGLVLNLAEKRLYYFPTSGKVVTYAVSIGREGWDTPLGNFSIVSKVKDPTWTPPASIRAEHAEQGEILPAVVPAGPDNPLGQYALRLSAKKYLIHGTNKPWGLGMQVSHGCIRMYPEDIEQLFPEVPIATPVTIVYQPFKVGWRDNDLYLEVHAKDKDKSRSPKEVIPPAIAEAQGVNVDWREVRRAIKENTGLPHLVGGRQQPPQRLYLDRIF